jgi:protein ImuA
MSIARFPSRTYLASHASHGRASAAPQWLASGHSGLDRAIGGGFRYGGLHELFAESEQDAPAVSGLAAILSAMAQAAPDSAATWIGTSDSASLRLYPQGLVELTGSIAADLLVGVANGVDMLCAAGRAASRPGIVVLESRGNFARYDLTASRRLHLAAETSGALLLLLRIGAEPVPSAALTRWAVKAAPSVALEANAPGYPAFYLTLLRQRGGPSGQSWRLEWDRDAKRFHEPALPGAVVPASASGAVPSAGLRLAG